MNINPDLMIGAVCWAISFVIFAWKVFHRRSNEDFVFALLGSGISVYCAAGITFFLVFPGYTLWSTKTLQLWSIAGMFMVVLFLMITAGLLILGLGEGERKKGN